MTHIRLVIVFASVCAFAGCDSAQDSNSARQTNGATSDRKETGQTITGLSADTFPSISNTKLVQINGLTIRYPKSLKRNIRMNDNGLEIAFEDFSFDVRDNRITVDGADLGAVSEGDDVLIGFAGNIAVNEKIRTPKSTLKTEPQSAE